MVRRIQATDAGGHGRVGLEAPREIALPLVRFRTRDGAHKNRRFIENPGGRDCHSGTKLTSRVARFVFTVSVERRPIGICLRLPHREFVLELPVL